MRWEKPFLAAVLSLVGLAHGCAGLFAQPLVIAPSEVRIQPRDDGGCDLYVAARPGVGSVLLTESTRDPKGLSDNFAYRSADYNPVNGDEKRMLNGALLPASAKLYSLISSTPVPDPRFGSAYHILIPRVLIYGYRWSRSGSVAVGKGTYLNIRAFERPYGDYSGPFRDNPYEITVSAVPATPSPEPATPAPPEAIATEPANDNTAAGTAFTDIAEKASGDAVYAADAADTATQVGRLLERIDGESLDLVICLDTTGSMEACMPSVKKQLTPIVREKVAKFKSFRVGIVLYKDYWPEEYITRKVPFTSNLDQFNRYVQSLNPYGGGDVPEAVDEALYAAATEFDWKAQKRLIILVGDAPPHPIPRGKIGLESVIEAASARSIQIDTIIEPLQSKANG